MHQNKKSNAFRAAGMAGMLLAVGGLAFAAGESVETVIKSRQQHLKDMGAAFKTLRDETRKSEPAMAQVKGAADEIAKAASQIDTWFPAGSGPESKLETDAKPEIWADPQGFAAAAKNLKAEAPKLQQLASANDLAGVKAQIGKVGGACKGCHDKYRVPEER
jgi:cytochrome c556